MKVVLFLLLSALLLSSCAGFPLPAAPTPFPTLTRPPVTPQVTGTPIPAALLETPTPSDVVFRDDFNIAFASGWDWKGPDPDALSLTAQPGLLQMSVGTAYAFDEGLANLFLRAAPEADFDIETRLVYRPHLNYDFAGIIVYESAGAYLQAGRSVCRGDPGCVGDGIYMDEYIDGQPQPGAIRLHHGQGNLLFLRLQRRGQDYTLLASGDGRVWSRVGTLQGSIDPVSVGLFAGQGSDGATEAYFDYFEISNP